MQQKVVIIGHGYTSRLAVIRSVAQIGCEVTVIVMTGFKRDGKTLNTQKPIDCHSKYVSHIFYNRGRDDKGLIQLLLDKCIDTNQKVIIIPDSDYSAAIIDDNKERLSKFFLFPHITKMPKSVRYWMNKENQKALALDIDLNFAKSHQISINQGKYTIPQGIAYPCFTKPVITLSGGKKYFRKCDNEKQLKSLLDFIGTKENITILVEDYVNIQTEYAVLGIYDGKNVIIPGVVQFKENCKSHFGIALKGQVIPVNGFESILEQFKEYVKKIGFVGMFDIDFFYGDGKWWFGEINLRFGGSGYAITKMGVNLPGMLVKVLRGESIELMRKEVIGAATYVNDRMLLDDWYRGYVSTKNFKRTLSESCIHFVEDKEDRGPQKAFKKAFRKLFVKWLIKKCIGRI